MKFSLVLVLSFILVTLSMEKPNIILLLADDLGYGDTSVVPFFGSKIQTPHLEKMASHGLLATNFHTAAPICTPSRGSILTGLFPWRLGISAIFGSGRHAMDTLLQSPNAPMIFKENGYHTAHIGKWHLGGMTPSDLQDRSEGRCGRPGIHQHGFLEYVAMAEGPESARLTELLPGGSLYSRGQTHLLHNEQLLKPQEGKGDLTFAQASHAIRVLEESILRGQPLYMHVWFDSPHGPWEVIDPFHKQYGSLLGDEGSIRLKYASMVSSLDSNVGRILTALRRLGLSNNTLVLFTSDNGPERGTGTAGPFKEGKRSLMEGGVRVPAIWMWEGVIPANASTDAFMVGTDLLPTFLHAAGISPSPGLRLDGKSQLSVLRRGGMVTTGDVPETSVYSSKNTRKATTGVIDMDDVFGDARPVLWRKAVWWNGFKLHEGANGQVSKFFDMRVDPTEDHNLLSLLTGEVSPMFRDPAPREMIHLLADWSFLSHNNRRNTSVLSQAKDVMATMLVEFRTKGDLPYRKKMRRPGRKQGLCSVPNASNVSYLDFGRGVEAPRFDSNNSNWLV